MKKLLYIWVLSFTMFTTVIHADITAGLVAQYKFENNVNDSTVNDNNGTIVPSTGNHVSYVNGVNGQAIFLNESAVNSDYIEIPLASKIWTNGLSVCTWANFQGSNRGWERIFEFFGGTTNQRLTRDGTSSNVSTDNVGILGTVDTGTFHHYCITYGRTDETNATKKAYRDGQYIGQATSVSLPSATAAWTTYRVGGSEQSGDYKFYGYIDDFRVYERALSDTDVTELYNIPNLTLKAHGGALQISNSVLDTSGFTAHTNQAVTNFTIEWWMNPSAHFNTGNTIGYGWGSFLFHDTTDGSLYVGINGDNNANRLTSADGLVAGTLELNKWQHFAFTFDASNGAGTLYKNGVALASKSGMSLPATFGDFVAGKAYTSGLSQQFALDEVRVWNIAKTEAQIKASMNQQLDGNESGLLAYYNFDERIGVNVKDIAGHDNNATMEDNAMRLNFLGDGLSFSGISSGVQTTASLNCTTYPNFSLGAWIKPTGSQTGWHAIFTQSNSLGIDLNNGTLGSATFATNQWSHVARSQEGSTVRYYVNGGLVLEASQTCSGNDNPIFIGTHAGFSGSFIGDIAEASIWTKALTQAEILHLMLSAPNLSDTNLTGYWPLNEGAGTTVYDYSLSPHTGTISGATWMDNAPTIYGNNIYTSLSIVILNKLIVENNTSTPTYSYNGNVPLTVPYFNGTAGVFAYYSQTATAETLDINASDGGVNLNALFNVIPYTNSTIYFTLNMTNVSLLEHNITNVQIIGQDGTSESLLIPEIASANIHDGNNTYTVPIYNPDNNFSIRVDLNDSTQWWVNFNDGKLYRTNDASSNFKTLIGSATDTLSIDFINANFYNTPPTLSHVYDRFRTPSEINSTISFDVNDTDSATLMLTVMADNNNTLNTANFPLNSSVSANQTQTITIVPISASSMGNTRIIIILSDGTTTAYESFNVNLSYEFGIITTKEEATISGIDYNGTLYALSSNLEENNITVEYEKLKVINSLFDSNLTVVKDINGTVSLGTRINTMPKPFQYADTNLGSGDLNAAYSGYGTPFTFTEGVFGTKVYVTYPTELLESYASDMRDQYGSFFTSISSFMNATVQGSATKGIRNHARNKLLVFNQNEVEYSSGTLIELDENGSVLTANAGTWVKQTVSSQEVLLIHPTTALATANGYNTDIAFVYDGVIVKGASYKASGDIYSSILLDKAAKDELYHSLSPNPKIATPLNNGYTYISLPSSNTLCDENTTGNSLINCDQNNTLESVFGTNSHVDFVFKFGREWMYWDSNVTANPAYSMQKFSTINPLEGIMVKTTIDTNETNETTVYLPFDEDSEVVNDYTNLFPVGWTLMSNNKDQTVGEISTALTAKGKELVYILLLRDNVWQVYAPTNNSAVNASIPRLTSVNRYESYWVYFIPKVSLGV